MSRALSKRISATVEVVVLANADVTSKLAASENADKRSFLDSFYRIDFSNFDSQNEA
jgi:hypothetical protein